jgi:hypothetical protein
MKATIIWSDRRLLDERTSGAIPFLVAGTLPLVRVPTLALRLPESIALSASDAPPNLVRCSRDAAQPHSVRAVDRIRNSWFLLFRLPSVAPQGDRRLQAGLNFPSGQIFPSVTRSTRACGLEVGARQRHAGPRFYVGCCWGPVFRHRTYSWQRGLRDTGNAQSPIGCCVGAPPKGSGSSVVGFTISLGYRNGGSLL